jgi:hypothetical protein
MKANVEALEVSGRNLELQKKLGELEAVVKDLEAKLTLTGQVFRRGDFVYKARRDGWAFVRDAGTPNIG